MIRCKWDRDAEDYLVDGEPCRVDDYGDPTRHCTSRLSCSQHIGWDEITCPRCIGRTRQDIRRVVALASLLPTAALESRSIESEAVALAGPAADVEAWTWRKVAARQGRAWHVSLIEDDDEHHPYTVLTRWQMMLSEDYGHDLPERMTTTGAADYLDRNLHKIAQDEEQEFGLLAREMRACRQHLESVLRNAIRPERGLPCPTCTIEGNGVNRLVRQYPHWCDDPDCCREHYMDDSRDTWACPRDRRHEWTHQDYVDRLAERRAPRRSTA